MNHELIEPAKNLISSVWNVVWTSVMWTVLLQITFGVLWISLSMYTFAAGNTYILMNHSTELLMAVLLFFVIPITVFVFRVVAQTKRLAKIQAEEEAQEMTVA